MTEHRTTSIAPALALALMLFFTQGARHNVLDKHLSMHVQVIGGTAQKRGSVVSGVGDIYEMELRAC